MMALADNANGITVSFEQAQHRLATTALDSTRPSSARQFSRGAGGGSGGLSGSCKQARLLVGRCFVESSFIPDASARWG